MEKSEIIIIIVLAVCVGILIWTTGINAVNSYYSYEKCTRWEMLTICQEEYLTPHFVGKVSMLRTAYRDVSCDEEYDREIQRKECVKYGK